MQTSSAANGCTEVWTELTCTSTRTIDQLYVLYYALMLIFFAEFNASEMFNMHALSIKNDKTLEVLLAFDKIEF